MIKKVLLSRTTRLTSAIAIFISINIFITAVNGDMFFDNSEDFYIRAIMFYLASELMIIAFLNEVHLDNKTLVIRKLFEKERIQRVAEIGAIEKTLFVNSLFLIPNIKISFKDGTYARFFPLNNNVDLEKLLQDGNSNFDKNQG